MLKYLYSQVYTKEVPNELSLGFSILGCPVHCPECHSPHMWDVNCEGEGTNLTVEALENVIEQQKWVSCILFFGGEWDMVYLEKLLKICKELGYKTALYSGHELDWFKTRYPNFHLYLDYIKVGRYCSKYGSLDYPSTNQRLYTLKDGQVDKDITSLFWRTNVK